VISVRYGGIGFRGRCGDYLGTLWTHCGDTLGLDWGSKRGNYERGYRMDIGWTKECRRSVERESKDERVGFFRVAKVDVFLIE